MRPRQRRYPSAQHDPGQHKQDDADEKQAASDSGISRVDAIPALDQMEERGNADGACCENRKYAAKRNGYGDDVSRR
jgi:hypothetical protein